MKPVDFKPDGRKVVEFKWVGQSAANSKTRDEPHRVVGPRAAVVVRYVDESMTFNGRVDNTTVYAEGETIRGVRADCFAQLEALHAARWVEKLWVRFLPDALNSSRSSPFATQRVQVAATGHGNVWRVWQPADPKKDKPGEWREAHLGEPPVGTFVAEGYYSESYYAILCDPSGDVEAAVAAMAGRWRDTLARASALFSLAFASAGALDQILSKRGDLVRAVVLEAAKGAPETDGRSESQAGG